MVSRLLTNVFSSNKGENDDQGNSLGNPDSSILARLAGATLYLAYSAKESADSARTAAEIATATAETAKESVSIVREWFELSQRPFVNLGQWNVTQDRDNMAIQGRLYDVANVPTAIEKVCVWRGTTQTVESQRDYTEIELSENAIAFRDHYQWINYGVFPRPVELNAGERVGYLSTVYTISREGTSESETWRVDTEIMVLTDPPRYSFPPIDMYRTEESPC